MQEEKKTDIQDMSRQSTPAQISWTDYSKSRKIFKKKWPSIWRLPIVTDPFRLISNHPKSVLDVGATERLWESVIKERWPGTDYRSFDIDRSSIHDYYDFKDINRQFDCVICFEVLEHLAASELIPMIQRCISVCGQGGHLFFSVPNLLSDSFWQDFTHQTALSFWDLPALMHYCGLEILSGARWHRATLKRRLIRRYFLYPLFRAINKDFCQSVLMVGRKISK
jgi:SAM-dependent methyltransferase